MEEDDAPSSFFSRRAKFCPKKTAEEFQAAAELVKKIEEENSKVSNVEEFFVQDEKKKTKRKNGRTQKVNKKPEPSDVNDIVIDLDSFPEQKLSVSSKKKLKKLREEQELELASIEAENEKILAAVDVNLNHSIEKITEIAEDFERITVLSIMYMSKISRFRCYENDKFLDIFPKVAESFNLKVTEFLLCYKEKNITVDDSPKSLNITARDVLECIPYKVNENSLFGAEDSGNTFKITFQSNDSKKKTDMLVHKMEKMQDIMKKYSEQRNIPLSQIIFDFDGERMSGDETPAELDMESGCCIDVTILVPLQRRR